MLEIVGYLNVRTAELLQTGYYICNTLALCNVLLF